MERRDPRPALALGLVLAVALAGVARAEAPNARALFQQGVQSLRIGDYAAAVDAFRASYRKKPAAATVCNLALTYERWRNHDQEALDAYLTCATDDNTGTFKRHALDRVRALRDKVAVTPSPTARPEPVEESPPPVEAKPVPRQPEPTPSPPPRVVLAAPQPAPMPPPRRSHALLWAGVGVSVVGVALLGGAIAVGEQARSLSDSIEYRYGLVVPVDSQGYQDLLDARGKRSAAIGLYVAGGLVTGIGVSLMIADAAKGRASTTQARLGLGPTAGGGAALSLSLPLP